MRCSKGTIAEHEIDTVFDLAAQTIVGIAHTTPLPTFETTICGTWMLPARRVRRVVASTRFTGSTSSFHTARSSRASPAIQMTFKATTDAGDTFALSVG